MTLLSPRFKRIQSVLNCRMANLTVLLEQVNKPHNLSAIMRTCDAVGTLDVHVVSDENRPPTFNSTAQGSQKWVRLHPHCDITNAVQSLKKQGFQLYGTNLDVNARDYRDCDFCGPTAFVLGAEKWGLSEIATKLMDESIFIPMRGMVQSLNVSVATSTLLFEALRQRKIAGLIPNKGEGLSQNLYKKLLFEWTYPKVAAVCIKNGAKYPEISETGEIL